MCESHACLVGVMFGGFSMTEVKGSVVLRSQ